MFILLPIHISILINFSLPYKYTKNNSVLTNEQRDFYEKNGYILLRNLVSSRLLDELR